MGTNASSFLVGISDQYYNNDMLHVVFEFIGGTYNGHYSIDFGDGSSIYKSKNSKTGDQVAHNYYVNTVQKIYTVKFYNETYLVKTLNVCVPGQNNLIGTQSSGKNNTLLIVDTNGNEITFLYTGGTIKNGTMDPGNGNPFTVSNITFGTTWYIKYYTPGSYVATLYDNKNVYGKINVFIPYNATSSSKNNGIKLNKIYRID
jgi:hypothetical protein